MGEDRVTWMRVRGMRSLADIELDLSGLTVLIGDNGSGKSTIIEALELLRQVARPGEFVTDVIERRHGGLRELMRQDADALELSARVEGGGGRIDYLLSLMPVGGMPAVWREVLDIWADDTRPNPLHAISRRGGSTRILDPESLSPVDRDVPQNMLAAASFGLAASYPQRRLVEALARIDVHPSFDTRPMWLLSEAHQRSAMRLPQAIEATDRLDALGMNLTNCLQGLRNTGDQRWAKVLDRARVGLGHDLREIRTVTRQRGEIDTEVWFGSLPEPLPLSALSEGQLAYLVFVVLSELGVARSLVAMDEPELHLHPELLTRVVWMLEELAQTTPVVLATHSDRLLDALENPAASVVLCELDKHRATRLRRPDRATLDKWLRNYRGLGELRADGYEPHVFAPPVPDSEAALC